MRIAVAGGTGMVGSLVVDSLGEAGEDVVVLSRSAGVDLVSGDGVADALDGVEVVIDVTSTASQKAAECVAFFGAVARHLQAAGAAAGVRRIVTLSIVGIDGLDGQPHYAGKLAQERETLAGSVPTTILRATQFHDFGGQLIDWYAKGPLVPCPSMPVQTVELDAVVRHLVSQARSTQLEAHVQVDLAGPQRDQMRRQVRAIARKRGRRLFVVPVRLPGDTWRRIRGGALQAPPGAVIDGVPFDEWLGAH